ncbi:MAG: TAXI family TRAP transporter solute-binding subunit [Spirochaetia bacterium]|nr:TAXI family TRAP transporter solute-binding subunit [Spirochaetia bacterium]
MHKVLLPAVCLFLFVIEYSLPEGQNEIAFAAHHNAVMGASSLESSWYPTASRISGVCMKYSDTIIAVQASGGGADNITLMKSGKYDLGITEANVMSYGYQGIKRFNGNPYPGMRFVTNLYPVVFQAIVQKNNGINSLYDLKGKTFSPVKLDVADVTGENTWQEIFEAAFNIRKKDINWHPLSEEEKGMAFKALLVDALGYETVCPSGAVLETSARIPVKILSVGGVERERLIGEYSWYKPWVIPAGTYTGQKSDVETVAVDVVIIADEAVSEKIVYDLVSTIYGEGLDLIRAVHEMSSYISLDNALSGKGTVPLHPGAEKYYREKGLLK